jgi:DNA-binding NarL/FixJ family response regulator
MNSTSLITMRIGIVEDDRLLRDTLSLFLSSEPDITVSGAYGSAENALLDLGKTAPDILLVDLGLPGMSGLDFIRTVKKTMPRIELLVHTTFAGQDTLFSALLAGASGYLLKAEGLQEMIRAIRFLHNGGAIMSPATASMVLREFQERSGGEGVQLSGIEQTIIGNIAEAVSLPEVAKKSGISTEVVHAIIKNIYEKLLCNSLSQNNYVGKENYSCY